MPVSWTTEMKWTDYLKGIRNNIKSWHCDAFTGCCLLHSRMQWKYQPGEDAIQCKRWTLPLAKSSWWDILRKLWVLNFKWYMNAFSLYCYPLGGGLLTLFTSERWVQLYRFWTSEIGNREYKTDQEAVWQVKFLNSDQVVKDSHFC